MLCYREMRKEDLARWEELAKSEFLEEDFCSASYLRNKWRKIKGWILMTPDKEWIGCCFVDSYLHRYNPEGIHFLEYCTFPKFRGQGYAKYLVNCNLIMLQESRRALVLIRAMMHLLLF